MPGRILIAAAENAVLTFATLFPIVNPMGAAPIFLNLTHFYPQQVRTLISRRVAIYGFLLLGGSLTIGSAVLTFFGISLPTVQIAGGLILANTGWTMLNQENGGAAEKPNTISREGALQHAFYPLTLPLTVGPGCISVTVAFGAHIRQQSKSDFIPPFLGALAGMFLVCVALALCYQHAARLAALLGPSGTNIVLRLSAFLLVAMGVQIIWNGLSALLATLLG